MVWRKNFCVVPVRIWPTFIASKPSKALLHRGKRCFEEDPMYPIALYGGLPEIAYLAPRGNFLAPRMADEDERPRRTREQRDAAPRDAPTAGIKPE